MSRTTQEYDSQMARCRDLFTRKTEDYGTAWRVLRIPSLIDQIFIKAQRIRSIEDKGEQKVQDSIESEYIGIINYCLLTLIQMELGSSMDDDMDNPALYSLYDSYAARARALMELENHDYGEAWRDMYMTSLTDMILQKLMRVRQILKNKGRTQVSEGLDANLYDMINYAVFALIRLQGQGQSQAGN